MKKSNLFAGVALAGMLLSASALSPVGPLAITPAQAQSVSVSFNLFFDELEPHGVWVRHPEYRHVFCPTGVDANWRPYTRGRWLYLADHGWYFASEEPFAWATYHYGRWLNDDNLGWCWVPGTKWAPAWVSWRRGGDVVGWAPLPPEGRGYSVSVDVVREDFPESYWVFVPTRQFIEPNLSVSIVFGADARDYYRQTEFLGPVRVEGDLVVNNVLEVTYIEQQINEEVTIYNAETASDPQAAAVEGDSQTVQIFAQDIEQPSEEAEPEQAVDEAEAAAVITEEGGTIGAQGAAETEADPAGETADPASEEQAEPEATTTPSEVTEPETETAPEAAEEVEQQEPAATTEENPEAEAVPADEEPVEESAAPAAEDAEQTADPVEAQDESAAESAAPVEADAPATEETEAAEEAAPAGEEGVTELDCPPERLVDGVCLPPEDAAPAEEEGSSTEEAPTN